MRIVVGEFVRIQCFCVMGSVSIRGPATPRLWRSLALVAFRSAKGKGGPPEATNKSPRRPALSFRGAKGDYGAGVADSRKHSATRRERNLRAAGSRHAAR